MLRSFRPRRRRAVVTVFLLAVAVAVLVAACGVLQTGQTAFAPGPFRSFAQPAGSTAPAAPAVAQPAARTAAQSAASAQAGQAEQPAGGASLPSLDRMVIRTAKLSLQVGDVEQALARTREIAQAGGGFLSASNTRLEQDRTVADLTIQVRADALDSSLQALRGLGKVESETSGSQDVTEEYVDLDANLRNLQASESAILRLLDRAQRIEDVISLQRELTNVRGQIQRLQGRKTYIERRTDMATINVSLHLPPAEGSTNLGGGFDPLAVARRGWNASLAVLRSALEVVIVVAAFSWWLVPLVAVGAYVYLHRRPRPAEGQQPNLI
jgi:Domain of unknown function (DUF4349)